MSQKSPITSSFSDTDYSSLLNDLKTRIKVAQMQAAQAVTRELLLLYWHVGREILARQQLQGWGSKVVNRLAQDLKHEFPDMKGFSRSNLMYMRAFAEAWPDNEIVQRALVNLPWRQNIALLEKLESTDERLWYAQQSIENGWSRNMLVAHIDSGLYRKEQGAITNFEQTLPPLQSDLAHQILKDPYNFDFLTLSKGWREQDVKRALVTHMRDFLLELGVGFSFVRHNYPINIGGENFCIDMLFYHLNLRCFIVIQLEMGNFRPEQSGQMNFYLSAIDDKERREYDQPTIGIILCKTKDRTIAEYSLRNLHNPIAVAEHRFPEALPSEEQLQLELDNAVRLLKGDTSESDI
ncbi:MAG: PDDEXK nuclease domain-containing protein [Cyanobacteria bacterium P01_F01_bin.86]